MPISQWSTSPANNASGVNNINWSEGQAPSTVNNSSRQEMTDIADWYRNDAEWIDRNDTIAFSSGTKVIFTGQDVTGLYSVNRRIRTVSSTPGTLHGRITASSTSGSDTLVTIAFDSTAVLSNEAISDVSIGIIKNSTASSSLDAENISRIGQFGMPTGSLMPFGSTTAPTGFALCNGQALNRATEAALFAVISTTYGSSSTSTFTVPDLRGRLPFGLDNMGGSAAGRITSTAADTLGGTLGNEKETTVGSVSGSVTSTVLTEANLPSSVTLTDTGAGDIDNNVTGGTFLAGVAAAADSRSITVGLGSGTAHGHADTLAFSGSTMAVLNPGMAMPWIIKK